MSNFLISYPTRLLYKNVHISIISYPTVWNLADLCLDSMSVTVCYNIYNFGLVYENINIFLSNDHIWNYRNLNSHISEIQLDILFKFSGFFLT